MGHLVRTLSGDRIEEELRQAYCVLAKTYLRHRAGGLGDVENADASTLQAAVLDSESLVNLSEAKAICELITADFERPGEFFNQLGHMSVLLAAASGLASCGLQPNICIRRNRAQTKEGKRSPTWVGTAGRWRHTAALITETTASSPKT